MPVFFLHIYSSWASKVDEVKIKIKKKEQILRYIIKTKNNKNISEPLLTPICDKCYSWPSPHQ